MDIPLRGEQSYIWQRPDWPLWRYDQQVLAPKLEEVARSLGVLMGRMAAVDQDVRDQVSLAALTEEVIKTSEIEGENLPADAVRLSIAGRLGMGAAESTSVDSE